MKKILLTGANGFIGKNIREILNNEYEIIEVTRGSKYDINKLESLLEIDNIDIVIHTAAKTFVPESFNSPYAFYKFNISSTLNIAEYCRIKKVKKLIYLNSYTYGTPKYLPIDEQHPVSFHSPYNRSKYIAEELLFNYLSGSVDVISLRLFNTFGKYQNKEFLIPSILKQAMENKVITVKDLKPKRDFIYIKDIVSLIKCIIDTDNAQGIYNVGSGSSYSVEEIINIIIDVLDVNNNISSENIRRPDEVMDCVANIEKIKKVFGWQKQYSIYDGIIDYINEVRKND